MWIAPSSTSTSFRSPDSFCCVFTGDSVSDPIKIAEGILESRILGESNFVQSGRFSAPGIRVGILSVDILLIAKLELVSDIPNPESRSECLKWECGSDSRAELISDIPENLFSENTNGSKMVVCGLR